MQERGLCRNLIRASLRRGCRYITLIPLSIPSISLRNLAIAKTYTNHSRKNKANFSRSHTIHTDCIAIRHAARARHLLPFSHLFNHMTCVHVCARARLNINEAFIYRSSPSVSLFHSHSLAKSALALRPVRRP